MGGAQFLSNFTLEDYFTKGEGGEHLDVFSLMDSPYHLDSFGHKYLSNTVHEFTMIGPFRSIEKKYWDFIDIIRVARINLCNVLERLGHDKDLVKLRTDIIDITCEICGKSHRYRDFQNFREHFQDCVHIH